MSRINAEFSPHSDYAQALAKSPGATSWYNFSCGHLGRLSDSAAGQLLLPAFVDFRQRVGDSVTASDLRGGRFFLDRSTEIEHIVGSKLPLPCLEFARDTDFLNFQRCFGDNSSTLAASIPISPEYVLRAFGLLPAGEMRLFSLVAYSKERSSGVITARQIIQHEKVHAIDPLITDRDKRHSDSRVLAEIIALVGEFAAPDLNHLALNVRPGYFNPYILRANQNGGLTSGLINLCFPEGAPSSATVVQVGEKLEQLVGKLTSRSNNTTLLRKLMKCMSFEDVHDLSHELMPSEYTARTDPNQSAGLDELPAKALQLMVQYFQGWPGSYVFTDRSISSLWREKHWGQQAMLPFQLGDVDFGKAALELFEKISGRTFDTSNITAFKVIEESSGGAHRITIKW